MFLWRAALSLTLILQNALDDCNEEVGSSLAEPLDSDHSSHGSTSFDTGTETDQHCHDRPIEFLTPSAYSNKAYNGLYKQYQTTDLPSQDDDNPVISKDDSSVGMPTSKTGNSVLLSSVLSQCYYGNLSTASRCENHATCVSYFLLVFCINFGLNLSKLCVICKITKILYSWLDSPILQ